MLTPIVSRQYFMNIDINTHDDNKSKFHVKELIGLGMNQSMYITNRPVLPGRTINADIERVFYESLCLLISMLWHMQAIFESKGDKLSFAAECRIRTQRISGAKFPADWMPADIPTELSRIKQNLKSTARRNDQRAFSPLDPTADIRTWLWR